MSVSETQILQRLAVLVMCHGLAVGQITSHYFLVQRPMSWIAGQKFCQSHYVDLAVLSSEEQYFTLLNAMSTKKVSSWLGLHRQNPLDGWKWVDGAELGYQRWYRNNQEGHCATLEANSKTNKKLLARYCEEQHMVVCQGPVSPQSVSADSVGADHVTLSWNVSAFMQTTPHHYNVTVNGRTHQTLLVNGSALVNISIGNLTSATEHVIEISAYIMRTDDDTGEKRLLQSNPTTLQVKTADSSETNKIITICLKTLSFVSLAPPLLILCYVVKKCKSLSSYPGDSEDSDLEESTVELILEETVVEPIPARTRAAG